MKPLKWQCLDYGHMTNRLVIKNDLVPNEFGYRPSEFTPENNYDIDEYKEFLFYRWYRRLLRYDVFRDALWRKLVSASTEQEAMAAKAEVIEALSKECIVPEEQQLIPYKYWAKPDEFDGSNIQQLYHPHWRVAWDIVNEKFKPNSKMLVVMPCGGRKPYSNNPRYKMMMKAARAGYFDLVIESLYPVPVYPTDFSNLYPYVISEWPIHPPSDKLIETYGNVHSDYMADFVTRHGYERVIYSNAGDYERDIIIEKVRKKSPCTVVNLPRETDMLKVIESRYSSTLSPGLKILRHTNLLVVRQYVARALGNPEGLDKLWNIEFLPLESEYIN